MNQRHVQFYQSHTLGVGERLMGHAKWPVKVQIVKVTAQARRPELLLAGSKTRLNLEIGGVPSGLSFEMQSDPSGPVLIEYSVRNAHVTVPASTEVRWKCVSGPDDAGDGLSDWLVTVYYQAAGNETRPTPLLNVVWVNGSERTVLYSYDPDTTVFTEAKSGIATGRATIQGGNDFSVKFASNSDPYSALVLAMQATADGIRVNKLVDNGNTAMTAIPRVEFQIGGTRVATLSKEGELRVNKTLEPDDGFAGVTGGTDRFGFKSGGVLKGILGLGSVGLQAGLVLEPAG